MESGLKVLTPAAVSKPKNPWGAPKALAPCSLTSVMDEELARELTLEEDARTESRYHNIRRGGTGIYRTFGVTHMYPVTVYTIIATNNKTTPNVVQFTRYGFLLASPARRWLRIALC